MQHVTVAIADTDNVRRAEYEKLLQSEHGIKLLANTVSGNQPGVDGSFTDRRLESRNNISVSQNEVARIKRLKPLVLLVNLNLFSDEDQALLLSLRHECPEVRMILLADEMVDDDQLIQAMEIGVRGYLKYDNVRFCLSKAIQVVGRGEIWASRKMLGRVVSQLLN